MKLIRRLRRSGEGLTILRILGLRIDGKAILPLVCRTDSVRESSDKRAPCARARSSHAVAGKSSCDSVARSAGVKAFKSSAHTSSPPAEIGGVRTVTTRAAIGSRAEEIAITVDG